MTHREWELLPRTTHEHGVNSIEEDPEVSFYPAFGDEHDGNDQGTVAAGHPYPATSEAAPVAIDDPGVLACRACGMEARRLLDGTTWRICRCGSRYCQWCLDSECHDCPALLAWDLPADAETEQSVPTTDTGVMPGWDDPHEALGVVPCRLTPAEAHANREHQIEAHRRRLQQRRAEARQLQKEMVRNGTRPKRERRRKGKVRFVTANVNCVDRLHEEISHGVVFKDADFLLIQETRTRGEAVDRARRRCREQGWDAVGGEAYLKESRAGGGTMVLAAGDGLAPLAEEEGEFVGRLTLGISSDLHGAVIGSHYGVTGGKVADQLPSWRRLATRLTALGRPFVVGGDWQVDPDDDEVHRFAASLDAIVVHPDAATNT